ncbi:MAG: kinase [Clostridiales bacterium]|nr:kinase [Clostridiales bacterium]
MRKLIVLRGNSGSGKTTVAKELQSILGSNTMLISQDMVRREILKVSDGKDTLALPLLKQLLQYGHDHSEIVILEGIMVADWYRPLFELAVSLYGNEVYAYYFDLPFEETVKRHQTRAKAGSFGEEAMKEWWVEKDYSDVLNETKITKDLSKDQIIQMITQPISGDN